MIPLNVLVNRILARAAARATPAARPDARESGQIRPLRAPAAAGGQNDAPTHRSRSPVGPQAGPLDTRDPPVVLRRLAGCIKHPAGLPVSTFADERELFALFPVTDPEEQHAARVFAEPDA